MCEFADFGEFTAKGNLENVLVLPDRPLVVHEVQHLPPESTTENVCANSAAKRGRMSVEFGHELVGVIQKFGVLQRKSNPSQGGGAIIAP